MTQPTKTAIVCEDGVSAEYEGVRLPLITTTPLKPSSEVEVIEVEQWFFQEQWLTIKPDRVESVKELLPNQSYRRAFEVVQEEKSNLLKHVENSLFTIQEQKARKYISSPDNKGADIDIWIDGYTQRNDEVVKLVEEEIERQERLNQRLYEQEIEYNYCSEVLIDLLTKLKQS